MRRWTFRSRSQSVFGIVGPFRVSPSSPASKKTARVRENKSDKSVRPHRTICLVHAEELIRDFSDNVSNFPRSFTDFFLVRRWLADLCTMASNRSARTEDPPTFLLLGTTRTSRGWRFRRILDCFLFQTSIRHHGECHQSESNCKQRLFSYQR